LWEAKNWSKKTNTEVINTLDWKINNHEAFCNVWLVISMNGFTDPTKITQYRKGSKHIIVLVEKEDIDNLIDNELEINNWFEDLFLKAIK